VLTNLGISYRHYGYFSRALAAWEEAWREGKPATAGRGRALVDRAVGELVRLRAQLGHQQRLATLLDEIGNRPVSGPATEMVQEGRETLWVMRADPKHLYLCGPTALKMLMLAQHASLEQVKFLNKVQAGPNGTSLAEVAALAKEAKLPYEAVFRKPGGEVPVPSIVHWKVGHFAAIVGEANGRFEVKDPTFGRQSLWVTPSALDAEASGYFLARATDARLAGWRQAGAEEAGQVWGAGSTTNTGGNPNCGMCGYSINEHEVSLHLTDTPVGYAQRSCGASDADLCSARSKSAGEFQLLQRQPEMDHQLAGLYRGRSASTRFKCNRLPARRFPLFLYGLQQHEPQLHPAGRRCVGARTRLGQPSHLRTIPEGRQRRDL
jgi:hypothetical protein